MLHIFVNSRMLHIACKCSLQTTGLQPLPIVCNATEGGNVPLFSAIWPAPVAVYMKIELSLISFDVSCIRGLGPAGRLLGAVKSTTALGVITKSCIASHPLYSTELNTNLYLWRSVVYSRSSVCSQISSLMAHIEDKPPRPQTTKRS